MTGTDPARWRPLAAALADTLRPMSPRWADVVAAVPRHVFVPRFHVQRSGAWHAVDEHDPTWLDQVYRDVPLVTELLPDANGRPTVVSSSTKPGLMLRMLDALDLRPDHRVLEIGTGTGFNAALLAQRLGDAGVDSVDIGAALVADARDRLDRVGLRPHLAVGDGTAGLPGRGPFDRIVATCSVPAVPAAWREQLVDGGLLLADLKIGLHAGSLVLLRRRGDTLTGRFLPRWAGFMPARVADTAAPAAPAPDRGGPARLRTTSVDPDPWAALVPWFLAQLGAPPITSLGRSGPQLDTTFLGAADGSWCEIGPAAGGTRPAREGGPRSLSSALEQAHTRWIDLGRPGWDRLGLTVGRSGKHVLWLDDPPAAIGVV